jgi:hypothetical protein
MFSSKSNIINVILREPHVVCEPRHGDPCYRTLNAKWNDERFQGLTAVKIWMLLFGAVSCGDRKFLRNVGIRLRVCTALQLRTPSISGIIIFSCDRSMSDV